MDQKKGYHESKIVMRFLIVGILSRRIKKLEINDRTKNTRIIRGSDRPKIYSSEVTKIVTTIETYSAYLRTKGFAFLKLAAI